MNPSATATKAGRSANGTAATPTRRKLEAMREQAKTDPAGAQAATWEWIKDLGDAHDEETLHELFSLGQAPRELDRQTEGILVTFTIQDAVDKAIGFVTGGWMPWLGKRFDAAKGTGDNVLTTSARIPSKLLWPLYKTSAAPGGRAAFDFETAVEPSRGAANIDTMKIDYGPVPSNPRLIIRRIRDELVELVPDTYLGEILWVRNEEPYPCVGYFALKQPTG